MSLDRCRLLPLAIACICEETNNIEAFMQELALTYKSLQGLGPQRELRRALAAKLTDNLRLLEQMHDSMPAPSKASNRPIRQYSNYQQLADVVTASTERYLAELQHAYAEVVSGYDDDHTGNCFYWLTEEGQDTRATERERHPSGTKASGCRWPSISAVLMSSTTLVTGMIIGAIFSSRRRRSADMA